MFGRMCNKMKIKILPNYYARSPRGLWIREKVKWLCYLSTCPLWMRQNGCAIFRNTHKCNKIRKMYFLIKISRKLISPYTLPPKSLVKVSALLSVPTLWHQDNLPVESCIKSDDFSFGFFDGTKRHLLHYVARIKRRYNRTYASSKSPTVLPTVIYSGTHK